MDDEIQAEACDICEGGFTLVDGELVPAIGTVVDEEKYYIDVCEECVEKYKIDFLYACVDNMLDHEEHIIGEEFPPPSIN